MTQIRIPNTTLRDAILSALLKGGVNLDQPEKGMDLIVQAVADHLARYDESCDEGCDCCDFWRAHIQASTDQER